MTERKLSKEQLEQELDKLQNSHASRVLIQLLESKVGELDTVSGVETIKELLGRKNAIRKLREIINRLSPQGKPSKVNEYN